jgi:hypothetical protein
MDVGKRPKLMTMSSVARGIQSALDSAERDVDAQIHSELTWGNDVAARGVIAAGVDVDPGDGAAHVGLGAVGPIGPWKRDEHRQNDPGGKKRDSAANATVGSGTFSDGIERKSISDNRKVKPQFLSSSAAPQKARTSF